MFCANNEIKWRFNLNFRTFLGEWKHFWRKINPNWEVFNEKCRTMKSIEPKIVCSIHRTRCIKCTRLAMARTGHVLNCNHFTFVLFYLISTISARVWTCQSSTRLLIQISFLVIHHNRFVILRMDLCHPNLNRIPISDRFQ